MAFTLFSSEDLERCLVSHGGFSPFPKGSDREAWHSLDGGLRKRLIASGEEYLEYEWPLVKASDYLEYVESGDRSRHAQRYFDRRFAVGTLALAECAEGKGRFLRQLMDGLWLICEETSWVIPAHERNASRARGPLPSRDIPDQGIDLFAAETGALLAWVGFLLGDELDDRCPAVLGRIEVEVRERIIYQFLDRTDQWWMGLEPSGHDYLNNWTPWCVSNCLSALFLVEKDDTRRYEGIRKAVGCLERYLDQQPEDGGCDEGPGYWIAAAGALCDCLDLFRLASGGELDAFGRPLVREMARFLRRVHIDGEWFVNFGDGGARLKPPPALLHHFGDLVDDDELKNLGLSFLSESTAPPARWYPVFRQLTLLFSFAEMRAAKEGRKSGSSHPPERSAYDTRTRSGDVTWLPDSEVFVCRSDGLFLAAKGAHNGESHNHNDVGQFVIFSDGEPFIIDAGVGEYTRKTFSDERYDIWTMQSAYHNLPRIVGYDQQPGKAFRASECRVDTDDTTIGFSLELKNAYPEDAGILQWQRSVVCHADDGNGGKVVLRERYELAHAGTGVVLFLMTPWEPRHGETTGAGGFLVLETGSGRRFVIEYPSNMQASWEDISLKDSRLNPVWGERLYRISLSVETSGNGGGWEISFVPDAPAK